MTTTNDQLLLTQLDANGVLRLTLNDARRRNALSEAMLNELQDVITAVATDDKVRVILLAGNGPAFCAGHDLKELTASRADADKGRAYFGKIMAMCSETMQALVHCPKPVIVEVAGVATAAGCQLVASCDLAVAADTARFSTPGVNIGLFCSTPMVALARNVHNKHAMEMLLTGDMISAARAEQIGLVNQVVNAAELHSAAMNLASKIAQKSSLTLSIGKRAFYLQREMTLADAYSYAADVMVENMLAQDAQEGIGAFIDKRAPVWRDA